MSSVSAAGPSLEARVPKRARGHARVAALLDAGAAVMAERGYDGATMTEIAARSRTAIGSLYRFFPTKLALADALLARHAIEIAERLAAIGSRVGGMTSDAVADALVDFMLEPRADREVTLALVDVCPDGAGRRAEIRETARRGIAAILKTREPTLAAERATDAGAVLLQMLKGARPLAELGAGPLAGLRIAVRLYVAHCLAVPTRSRTSRHGADKV